MIERGFGIDSNLIPTHRARSIVRFIVHITREHSPRHERNGEGNRYVP